MFEWHSVPGWVVAMMFGGMIALAYQLGTKTAELRFSGRDARRYSWLRRQHWVRDGAERLDGCDVDRMCDIGQVKDGIAAFAGSKTPNVKLTGILRGAGFGLGFYSPNAARRKMSG